MNETYKINFKFFIFDKCLNIKFNDGSRFTFRTKENLAKKIFQIFINYLKQISDCTNITCLQNRGRFHPIRSEHKEKIKIIYKLNGFLTNQYDQFLENEVYQIKLPGQGVRLMFILIDSPNKTNKNFLPLFIDANHSVYYDSKFEKEYHTCFRCFGRKCEVKSK